MSLLMLESFDDGLWDSRTTATAAAATTTGRTGANARRFNDPNRHDQYTFPPADEHSTFIVGFAFKHPVLDGADDICRFYGDDFGTLHITLTVTNTGRIQVQRGGSTLLGETDPGVITEDVWHYIEWYVTLSDTVGVVKLRVDGKTPAGWSDLTNQDTKNGGTAAVFDTVYFIGSNDYYSDDLYILNGAGSLNNDLLGDSKVETLYPDGNGNYSQLTGSDSNSTDNYLLVDENPADSADYAGLVTDGQKDTYTFDDLATTVGTVFGVMVSMWAAKSDSGAKSCRAVARRASTDATGADKTLQTTYAPHDQIWDDDPTDSTAWTIAKVNASEFGFEVRP